jgi:2-haloacid dehalogenase
VTDHIDMCLSVDDLGVYKPDPRVYQMACDRLNVVPSDVCFVSCNCWDFAGASSFGFNAVRINRQNLPQEYEYASLFSEQKSLLGLVELLAK